ncbi:hypothetical protein MPSEU_000479500 [Mayamaea pseudoterrestris]|nr:hypothetical protein MPSEU_000479500 [Mayamaea pseudoterrestris]
MFATGNSRELDESTEHTLAVIANRRSRKAADDFVDGKFDWKSLPNRIASLADQLRVWTAENRPELPYRFSDDPNEARRIAMTASVLVAVDARGLRPAMFLNAFESLFRSLLHDWDDYEQSMSKPSCRIISDLHTLGWIRPQTETRSSGFLLKVLQSAIRKTVFQHIKTTIQGQFDEQGLYQTVCNWRDEVVSTWVQAVLWPEGTGDMENVKIAAWKQELESLTAQCFCEARMEEIFDIVADYSDSHPAVEELEKVLETTQMHKQIAEVLGKELVKRLNHPGANTSQIIDVYIATIKVMRVIDPSDRLLEVVAEPVRSYLRNRVDTVRCIISSLTDAEAGGDLYQELRRQDAKPLENVTVDSDDEEECPDFNWQPQPSVYQTRGTFFECSGGRGDVDILAMLVSIYGSKELFVNEYRIMLADKLLANLTYDTDQDVHTLELLKLRFGESSMRSCEVMLKDLDDSKRTNTLISRTLNAQHMSANGLLGNVVDVATISHTFWPSLQHEPVKHHPRRQSELDAYAHEFERLKNPRKLIWFDQLGSVDLELDVIEVNGDGASIVVTKEFNCSPLMASLITHFEDKLQWTAEELSDETGISQHVLEKRLMFWVNHRVLSIVTCWKHTTTYEISSASHLGEEGASTPSSMMDEDYGGRGQAVSASAQEEEEMEAYESYIVGMLTNMQQLPLDRIHGMLKLFVSGSDIRYDKTPQQLHQFLLSLVRAEKLECGPDGMYKLYNK